MSTGNSTTPIFDQFAQQWARFSSPLRPVQEDLEWIQEVITKCVADCGSLTALILGVTPELGNSNWPQQCRVLAADVSMPMIRGVWQRQCPPASWRSALQADWFALPLADASCDLVLGDGCFVVLGANKPTELACSVRRVLRSGGLFMVRVFVRPTTDESPDAVWNDLIARRIGNFHIFKFRLLASLRTAPGEVRVVDAWQYFHRKCSDIESLAAKLKWDPDEIRMIEAYRDQQAVYWFPTVDEFQTRMSEQFEPIALRFPAYEMGDRCPTFLLRAR